MDFSRITFALAAIVIVFGYEPNRSVAQNLRSRPCGRTVHERLTQYFQLRETKPAHIINNVNGNRASESRSESVMIGEHKIEWTTKVEKVGSRSFIKIDGHLISFDGIESVNEADENQKIEMDVADEWRQIKLYKLFDQEIIGITIGPSTCTGLMCGVAAQVLYDVNTKRVTFFGTFRSDEEVRLFRLTNEEVFYYIAKRFDGDPHAQKAATITYSAYQLMPNGDFALKTNASRNSYFLKHTYYPNVFDRLSKKTKPAAKADILEQRWIEKID